MMVRKRERDFGLSKILSYRIPVLYKPRELLPLDLDDI